MSSVRIAFVVGTTSGGTGRHVAMLAAACVSAGAQVKVFGPQPVGGLSACVSAVGGSAAGGSPVEFAVVAIADRPRPAGDLAAVRRLRRLLSSWSPDVVHAHGLRAGAVAALGLGLGARPLPAGVLPSRVPLVVTVHNAPPPEARLAAIYSVLERIVARRADVVLCVSPDLEARMRRLGARSVARAIVPAPIPDQTRPHQSHNEGAIAPSESQRWPEGESASGGAAGAGAARAGAGAGQPTAAELVAAGRPIVLGAGRLAAQKDFGTLLAAAAGWQDREPVPLVVIAGDGPLAGSLAARAVALGVDARFLGPRSDVGELLAVADVFVLSSRWEGQPLILSEALRAGRPIVATDVGGVRALLGAEAGATGPGATGAEAGASPAALLVPAADPVALGAAVRSVLDDPELAAGLSTAALARAARLPTEADAGEAALAVYRGLTRRPPPPSDR